MEAVLVLLALAAVCWIFVGPFLFFSHSSRISHLTDEIARLRRELDKKSTAQTNQIAQLSDQLQRLSDQDRVRATHADLEAGTAASETHPETPAQPIAPIPAKPEAKPKWLPGHITSPPVPLAKEVTPADSGPAQSPTALSADLIEDTSLGIDSDPSKESAPNIPAPDLSRKRTTSEERSAAASTASTGFDASKFNELVASQWLSWVGAVAVMIGVGFGLKYAIEEQYLGPTGRVALGILSGVATFVAAAFAMKKDYRVLAEGLSGTAMGILYFSLFAAFQWYDLLPQMVAFAGMVLVTATGLSFAGKFNSLPSAVLAMIGGFLTPFMLARGGGNISTLFTYILILDLGVLGLATFRSWGQLHLLNFGGTLLIWIGWLSSSYKPEELWLTVAWITLFAVVFSLMGMWRHVIRRENSSTPDMTLMLLTPIAYFGALYVLTKAEYSNYHGLMALLVASYYLILGMFAYARNPGNNSVVVTLVGVGLSFVTLAVPLQLSGHWIVIAWAVESLLLIEIGLRYEKPGFRLTGFALLAVVQLHMVMYTGGTLTGPNDFTTGFVRRQWEDPVSVEAGKSALGGVINGRSMSFLVNAIVLAILAWEYRRREKSARIEVSDDIARKIGWKGSLPDAGQISMILIPLVPVMILAMGLLETFVHGVRLHWTIATHLSMLPIWLSFFALGTLLSFKRMNDVTTLGALAKCLYGITGGLFIVFFVTQFPDWVVSPDPLWGRTLFNPRGIGFLSALGAVLVGAIQFSRSDSNQTENHSIGTSLTLAVPLVLLGMSLTETFAFGQRHQWLWATQLSQGGIWLAIFATGTLMVSRWLSNDRKLGMLSRLFYITTAGLMLLLLMTTFGDATLGGQTTVAEAWSRPLLNPRGLCLLVGALSLLLGVIGQVSYGQRLDRLFATAITLAVPLTLLSLGLIETYAYGCRHRWIWASHWSSLGIWLSLFAIGVGWASRRWLDQRAPLWVLSQLLITGGSFALVVLFLGTLVDWNSQVRQTLSNAWSYPFLNPRGICFLLAITAALVERILALRIPDTERPGLFRINPMQLGFMAYAIMFLMFTIEVFAMGKQYQWKTATSLAITGTWAVLAVITIGAGLLKRSAPVRILALGVFALTTAKVFLYDVWYLDKPIRAAAFVGLGVALFCSTFLYRRFSGQLKDWIKPLAVLLAAALGWGADLHAAEPDLSTRFTHRFELTPTPPALIGPGLDVSFTRIPVTAEMYAASQKSLTDLRILSVDPAGISTQIPYILLSPVDEQEQADIALPVIKRQDVGDHSELIVDARNVTATIESIRLNTAPQARDYVRTVRLYGSNQLDDGDWKLLVNDAFIFDRLRDSQRLTESTIACPSSPFRYYRIVIENEGADPLALTGATARMVRRQIAPRVSYPVEVKNEIRTDQKITRVELTLPGPAPIDRLDVTIAGADDYHRNAQLTMVYDTSTRPLASPALFHLASRSKGPVATITFPTESHARFWLDIQNGDDQPLTVTTAIASGTEKSLVVPWKALTANPNPISIFIGSNLGSPSYDLARTTTLPAVEQMTTLSVFPGQKNAAYVAIVPKRAWAEEHHTLVWGLVVAGVLILSAIAALLLKAAGAQTATRGPTEQPTSSTE